MLILLLICDSSQNLTDAVLSFLPPTACPLPANQQTTNEIGTDWMTKIHQA
jgi:hypothetical protein